MGAPKKWIHSVHFRKMFEGENISYLSLEEYDRRFGKGREYEFHHRLGDDERMEERSGGWRFENHLRSLLPFNKSVFIDY